MSLANLSQLQAEQEGFKEIHAQQSHLSYQKALKLIAKSKKTGFNDKVLLHQAIDILVKAIGQNRQNPDPYVAMGYLFLLLKDKEHAQLYLEMALSLDPEHRDAQSFLSHLMVDELEQESVLTNNYDELYDETENFIFEQLSTIQHSTLPQTAYTADTLEEMIEQYDRLNRNYTHIQSQLEKLYEEFEITSLKKNLNIFETHLKRLQATIDSSRPLVKATMQIQQMTAHVRVLTASWNHDTQLINAKVVEEIYDQCDVLANFIDNWEEQGLNTQPIEAHYESLIECIGILQEIIEENLPKDF